MGLEDIRRLRGLVDNLADDVASSRAARTIVNAFERHADDAASLNFIARNYRANGLMNDAGRLTDEGFDQINEALYQFASENNMNNAAARNFVRETVGEIEAEGARLANAGADATADAAGAGARRGADDAPRVDEAPAPPRAGNMLTPEQTAIVRRAQQDAAQISSDLSTESLRHGSEALANINQRMVNIRAANELNVGEEIVGNTPREILEGLQDGMLFQV